jgi:hypothetical protein
VTPPGPGDPFAYRSAHASRFVARAISGESDVLFTASPGGAVATAARVNRLRPLIDTAVAGTGVDPDLLEGLVFVESAGRVDAMAPQGPAGASGLTQILPATATSMLGLHVNTAQSQKLSHAIADAQSAGATPAAVNALAARRAAVDQRFSPRLALAATVRYLLSARAHFGRTDLAFESYHMGVGNLSQALADYDGRTAVPYAQLYFDTAPDRHPAAYALLSSLSDQSSLYLWRILGAAALMHLYRTDRAALTRLADLEAGLPSGAGVLHPPTRTPAFTDPQALSDGYRDGALEPLPSNAAALGLRYASSIGAQGAQLHAPAGLYRGLRPAAVTLLVELAARVKALSHGAAPLEVTSAVTDAAYQARLGTSDPSASAGYSFTLARRYVSTGQADALQAVLDRLQALSLARWTAYPGEIEITVASDAATVIRRGI